MRVPLPVWSTAVCRPFIKARPHSLLQEDGDPEPALGGRLPAGAAGAPTAPAAAGTAGAAEPAAGAAGTAAGLALEEEGSAPGGEQQQQQPVAAGQPAPAAAAAGVLPEARPAAAEAAAAGAGGGAVPKPSGTPLLASPGRLTRSAANKRKAEAPPEPPPAPSAAAGSSAAAAGGAGARPRRAGWPAPAEAAAGAAAAAQQDGKAGAAAAGEGGQLGPAPGLEAEEALEEEGDALVAEAAQRVSKGAMSITDAAVHAALNRLGKESLQGLLAEAAAGAATQGGQAQWHENVHDIGACEMQIRVESIFFCG